MVWRNWYTCSLFLSLSLSPPFSLFFFSFFFLNWRATKTFYIDTQIRRPPSSNTLQAFVWTPTHWFLVFITHFRPLPPLLSTWLRSHKVDTEATVCLHVCEPGLLESLSAPPVPFCAFYATPPLIPVCKFSVAVSQFCYSLSPKLFCITLGNLVLLCQTGLPVSSCALTISNPTDAELFHSSQSVQSVSYVPSVLLCSTHDDVLFHPYQMG